MKFLIAHDDHWDAVLVEADNEHDAVKAVLEGNGTVCGGKEVTISAGGDRKMELILWPLGEVENV